MVPPERRLHADPLWVTVLALSCCACGGGDAGLALDPASGSSFGHFPVEIDLSGLGIAPESVTGVAVGGVPTYQLDEAQGELLTVWVQGHPEGGEVDLVIAAGDVEHRFSKAFEYQTPSDPVFERMVAIGASLSQGVQAGVPSYHGSLQSPPSLIGQRVGAYLSLPLLVPGLFPAMQPSDIGPAPECEVPDVASYVAESAVEVLGHLTDDSGEFGYHNARVDPDMMPRNLSVGGTNIGHLVDGYPTDDFGVQFVAHLVLDPYGGLIDEIPWTQMELLEAEDPTLVVSTDLFGNDIIGAFLLGEELSLEFVTEAEAFQVDLDEVLERLSATGAEVFLATLPRPSLLPATSEKGTAMIEAGTATEQEVAELVDTVDGVAADYNDRLEEGAGSYDNIHVVDLAQAVVEFEADGLQVGGQTITVEKFGGLLSLDGVHFSDLGYALVANQFMDVMTQELGVQLDGIDLEAVLADDPYAPDTLRDGGLDPEDCDR
ncbi:MAG: hypothetical protein QGG40_04255 [Myxococcota bacterium]|nr:hypothetical protein [Myxococcota bacterium]